ncbi:unnamed protein product, partial [Mesorhabditis belari]|uniref:Transmembrane protein n=1 Tax=Mesorhabditis belari TaxID=2138241 RepID=A0AAF3FRF2_9BILA
MSNRPSIELPASTKRDSLMPGGNDQPRKGSFLGPKASFSEDGKGQLKTLLQSRPPCKTRAMNPLGQLVLCIFGCAVSLAICLWLAFFSGEHLFWKRLLFSSGAAVCSLMFALLAYTSKRRIDNPPEPEPLPDLSQRRSTIGGRSSKKSIAQPSTSDHPAPTQVLIVNNKD